MQPNGVFNGVRHNQYGPPLNRNNSTDVSAIISQKNETIAHLEQYIRYLEQQQRDFEESKNTCLQDAIAANDVLNNRNKQLEKELEIVKTNNYTNMGKITSLENQLASERQSNSVIKHKMEQMEKSVTLLLMERSDLKSINETLEVKAQKKSNYAILLEEKLETTETENKRLQAQLSQELDLNCSVCLEDACYSCIACKKLFHKKCIGRWMETAPTCPNCRRTVFNGRSSV